MSPSFGNFLNCFLLALHLSRRDVKYSRFHCKNILERSVSRYFDRFVNVNLSEFGLSGVIFILSSNLRPVIRHDGVRGGSEISSYKNVSGREFSIHSVSIKTVSNSSYLKLAFLSVFSPFCKVHHNFEHSTPPASFRNIEPPNNTFAVY